MLKSGMGRFILGSAAALIVMVAGLMPQPVLAQSAMPVRGVIVTLREDPALAGGRESPQAVRERIQGVSREAGVALAASRPISRQHHLLRLPQAQDGAALDDTMRRLRLHPQVKAVEPDVLIRRQAVTPNDTDYNLQWNLAAPTVHASAINMPDAWSRTTGTAVVIAVLDTGVRFAHPDLAGRLLAGYDMVSEVEYANDGNGRDADPSDPGDWVSASDRSTQPGLFGACPILPSSWHGTFISGQIAALSDNAMGVAGINWAAQILPVRVSGKCGAFLSDIFDGMRWAAGLPVDGAPANTNPARIINLSFGGDATCSGTYQDVIDEVTAAGTLVVVAAGNESGALRRPADCARVMTVAAVQDNGAKTTYSNFGPKVALAAPGGTGSGAEQIYGANNTGNQGPATDTWGYKSGTSFAVPQAVGVASLMLALNPALTPAQIIARMKAGTRPHVSDPMLVNCSGSFGTACNCTAGTCGAGLLDADLALAQSYAPAAVIAAPANLAPGSTISLDGRGSAAVSGGSITQYQWSQVSGPAVTIVGASSALATVTLPATAGVFVFRLTVTDDSSRTGEDTAEVSSQPQASSGGGGGGGATGLAWGMALWLLVLLVWAWPRLARRRIQY